MNNDITNIKSYFENVHRCFEKNESISESDKKECLDVLKSTLESPDDLNKLQDIFKELQEFIVSQ